MIVPGMTVCSSRLGVVISIVNAMAPGCAVGKDLGRVEGEGDAAARQSTWSRAAIFTIIFLIDDMRF